MQVKTRSLHFLSSQAPSLLLPWAQRPPKGKCRKRWKLGWGGMCSVAPTHLQPVSFPCCLSLPSLTPAKHVLGTTLQFHTHPSAGMSSSPNPVQNILSGKTFDVPQGQDDSPSLWALPPTLVILCTSLTVPQSSRLVPLSNFFFPQYLAWCLARGRCSENVNHLPF